MQDSYQPQPIQPVQPTQPVQPVTPPQKKNSTALIIIIIATIVLVVTGIIVALALLKPEQEKTNQEKDHNGYTRKSEPSEKDIVIGYDNKSFTLSNFVGDSIRDAAANGYELVSMHGDQETVISDINSFLKEKPSHQYSIHGAAITVPTYSGKDMFIEIGAADSWDSVEYLATKTMPLEDYRSQLLIKCPYFEEITITIDGTDFICGVSTVDDLKKVFTNINVRNDFIDTILVGSYKNRQVEITLGTNRTLGWISLGTDEAEPIVLEFGNKKIQIHDNFGEYLTYLKDQSCDLFESNGAKIDDLTSYLEQPAINNRITIITIKCKDDSSDKKQHEFYVYGYHEKEKEVKKYRDYSAYTKTSRNTPETITLDQNVFTTLTGSGRAFEDAFVKYDGYQTGSNYYAFNYKGHIIWGNYNNSGYLTQVIIYKDNYFNK